jgi:hypothetical protein
MISYHTIVLFFMTQYCPPTFVVTCQCAAGTIAPQEEAEEIVPLSASGLAAAESFGLETLEAAKLDCDQEGSVCNFEDNDVVYVGDKFVLVLYQEEDRIYEVLVTADDGARRSRHLRI